MRLLLPLLVATALAVPAASQERPSPFRGDPRLDKRITVRWKKATLHEALAGVTRSTGVRLSPDRALVDEPVMVAATEVPARDLLEHVAKLLHYTWVRDGGTDGAPTYLLFQDAR